MRAKPMQAFATKEKSTRNNSETKKIHKIKSLCVKNVTWAKFDTISIGRIETDMKEELLRAIFF